MILFSNIKIVVQFNPSKLWIIYYMELPMVEMILGDQ